MSNYYVRRSGEDDYLEHAGGWKWSKPTKYIDKIMKNGRWVYVYARNKANSVASNVRRSFNRATGLSDRRAANIASNRWRESLKGGNRAYTHTLRARANKFQNRYNKSLLGRAESALSRVSSAGANARNGMAKAAGQARAAAASFTGSIRKGAYQVGNAANKARKRVGSAIDTHITGSSAKRAMDAQGKNLEKHLFGKGKAKSNQRADTATKRGRAAQERYNKSLRGKLNRVFNFENDFDDARSNAYTKKRNALASKRSSSKKNNRKYGRYVK